MMRRRARANRMRPWHRAYGEAVKWEPAAPRIGLLRLLVPWAVLTASVYVAALLVPGVALERPGAGCLVALTLAFLNAIMPPLLAALRLPFMVAIGFIGILLVDAGAAAAGRRRVPRLAARGLVRRRAADVDPDRGRRDRAAGHRRAPTTTTSTRCGSRAGSPRRLGSDAAHRRRRGSSSWRSTASRCRCCGARCATAARRTWRAGSPTTATTSRSGRPTSPRRPAPARPASCSAPTRTSRRSAGSRRRPRR